MKIDFILLSLKPDRGNRVICSPTLLSLLVVPLVPSSCEIQPVWKSDTPAAWAGGSGPVLQPHNTALLLQDGLGKQQQWGQERRWRCKPAQFRKPRRKWKSLGYHTRWGRGRVFLSSPKGWNQEKSKQLTLPTPSIHLLKRNSATVTPRYFPLRYWDLT